MDTEVRLILDEVEAEVRFDHSKHGGAAHDDQHDSRWWQRAVVDRVNRASNELAANYRYRMIQAAALCVSAVLRYDRFQANRLPPAPPAPAPGQEA